VGKPQQRDAEARGQLSAARGSAAPLLAIAGALALVFAVGRFVPGGHYLLYPFTLFATWVHECGHALAAVLLGGHVQAIHVFTNAAGDAEVTNFGSWRDGVVCAGGLLAPPLVGSALALAARGPRRAGILLGGFAAAIALTDLALVRSLVAGLILGALALVLGAIVLRGSPRMRLVTAQLLAVELGLDWIARVDYFFSREAAPGQASDVATLARAAGGVIPYWAWGALLAAISVLAIYGALRFTLRKS
jgi:hypothetical protein